MGSAFQNVAPTKQLALRIDRAGRTGKLLTSYRGFKIERRTGITGKAHGSGICIRVDRCLLLQRDSHAVANLFYKIPEPISGVEDCLATEVHDRQFSITAQGFCNSRKTRGLAAKLADDITTCLSETLLDLQAIEHLLISGTQPIKLVLRGNKYKVKQPALGTRQGHQPVSFGQVLAVLVQRRVSLEIDRAALCTANLDGLRAPGGVHSWIALLDALDQVVCCLIEGTGVPILGPGDDHPVSNGSAGNPGGGSNGDTRFLVARRLPVTGIRDAERRMLKQPEA